MPLITGHTVATFGSTSGAYPLEIAGNPTVFITNGIPLLLFGAPVDQLVANIGRIEYTQEVIIDVPGGIITFSGGSTGTLPKRPETNPELKLLFSFDAKTGNSTSVGVSFNSASNAVVVTADIYGAISYSDYKTKAQGFTYFPDFQIQPDGGSITTYGVLCAFKKPSTIITFQVPATTVDDKGNDEVEIYRIVSYAVTNPQGEFEMPPGYPGSGTYPGLPAATIDVSTSMKTERVHEIGKMDSKGRAFITTYHVSRATPYTGDSGYTIPLVCKTNDVSSIFDKDTIAKAKDFVASRNKGCK